LSTDRHVRDRRLLEVGGVPEESVVLDGLVAEIGRRLDRSQATTGEFIDWAFAKHPVISVILAALGGEASLNLLKNHRRFREDLRSLADSALSVSPDLS
jgi:hypothetical protein